MRTGPVYVRAAGMACPVGLTWRSSCAAMRSGITRKSISLYRDNDGREIIASYLRDPIREDASADERWLYLLAYALKDIARQMTQPLFERIPLFLARPLPRDGQPYPTTLLADVLSTGRVPRAHEAGEQSTLTNAATHVD